VVRARDDAQLTALDRLVQFHHGESEMDDRLSAEIYTTVEGLYGGVEFRSFTEILEVQTVRALHTFLRLPRVAQDNHEAFGSNPHQQISGGPNRIWFRHVGSGFFKDVSRHTKRYHEAQLELTPVGGLQEQKRLEALRFIVDSYLRPFFALMGGAADIFTMAGLDLMGTLLREYSELLGREPTGPQVLAFLNSEELAHSPFIDIYSSLRAGMIVWHQVRRQRGSDLNDVLIAATVLPYCDYFATDGFVKQLVVSLGLDRKYNAVLFGSRRADIVTLSSRVRNLLN